MHKFLAILVLAFVCVSAKPLVHSAAIVDAVPAPVVTPVATSSQFFARNFNAYTAPLVASSPYIASPYVASPYVSSPYVASPYAYSYPYVL